MERDELRHTDCRKPKSGKYLKAHGYFDDFLEVGMPVKKRSKKRFVDGNYVNVINRLNVTNPFDPRGYRAVELDSGQIINSANVVPCYPVAPDHLYEPVGRGWKEFIEKGD